MVRYSNTVSSIRVEGGSSSSTTTPVSAGPRSYLAVASADFEIEAKWNAILKSWQSALGVTTVALQRERRGSRRRTYHPGPRNARSQNCGKGGSTAMGPTGEGDKESGSMSSDATAEFMTGTRSPLPTSSLMNFVLKVDCNHGRIIHASSSIKKALSLDNESIVGQPIEALLHPDDLEDFMLYCRCPSEYITCLPQVTKGSITAVGGSSSFDSNCNYVTFLCRMLNGYHGPNDENQYTVVRVTGKQLSTRVEEPRWQQNSVESKPALGDAEDATNSLALEKSSRSSPKIQKIFFSLVEVPTVSLKLELAPNPPNQFSMQEYMLTTDQSPTVLFADPRIERILGFRQVEVIGRTGYSIVVPKDHLFVVASQFDAVLRSKEPTPVAARLKTKAGKIIWSRSRVYLNVDHWTGKTKNYVTISSVISKRTAYKYFQRQIRIIHNLRKSAESWTAMLNLLTDLTEDQKESVSKMDLNTYLEDFTDCIKQFGVDKRLQKCHQEESFRLGISHSQGGQNALCFSEDDNLSTNIVLSADQNSNLQLNNNNNNQSYLTFSDDSQLFSTDESSEEDEVGGENFNPTPHIPDFFQFFPADFRLKYKVSPVVKNNTGTVTDRCQWSKDEPQSCSTRESSPISVSNDFSPLASSAPSNGLDINSCNLLESLCKLSKSTDHRTTPRCFEQNSLTRSLLSMQRDGNKPGQDFWALANTLSTKISASHLQNVRMAALTDTRPQKHGNKANNQKRIPASKRARKSINHS